MRTELEEGPLTGGGVPSSLGVAVSVWGEEK